MGTHPRKGTCFGRAPARVGDRRDRQPGTQHSPECQARGVGPEQTRITRQTSSRHNRWTGRPHRSPGNGAPPGVGRRSGRLKPGASATGDGKKAGDREYTEGQPPGSPGRPASAGTTGRMLTANRDGCSGVRPSGAPAHRHRDKQRSTQDARRPSMERSPRKHRATSRRKRQHVVTDLTVEQSPEVERPITADLSGTIRSRTVSDKRARIVNNGERERTAVARTRRLQCPAREGKPRFAWGLPNKPRRRREERLTRHRLPAREKLRRV